MIKLGWILGGRFGGKAKQFPAKGKAKKDFCRETGASPVQWQRTGTFQFRFAGSGEKFRCSDQLLAHRVAGVMILERRPPVRRAALPHPGEEFHSRGGPATLLLL
jgi:hypothetical protein